MSEQVPVSEVLKNVVGQKVKAVRKLTDEEIKAVGWDHCSTTPVVIELESGFQIYAQQDDENNGPGTLVLYQPKTDRLFYAMDIAR